MGKEKITIIGENYFGHFDKTRITCRAIILRDQDILLSYETKFDQWMTPGGGIENNESDIECVKREVEEETGLLIEVGKCLLEIEEFYENERFINRYFVGEIVGKGHRHLTKNESDLGMEPCWINVDKIIDIFSHHNDYKDSDEMRRGMYEREYLALSKILKK